ncbi:hypothetical protein [Spirosoma oryzicola]|uniref:hypothetical protein n=1 Tax=Spirosoma oryzicola TaxID=2898794 RepID=UPI001E35C68B|nr:hypothetical protein [Spirosoma oryzicola]UHG93403.1 hypothetical protein LQ777_10970 [Spirosoma oryzicola]
MNERDQIARDHPFSYKGIFRAYDFSEIRDSNPFRLSIALSIGILFITKFSEKSYYEILTFWVAQIMAVFPNLLGFNLGGYALIVGFGNGNLLKAMTRKAPNKRASIFQKLSGVFAFSILLQLAAFIVAFSVNFLNQYNFKSTNDLIVNTVNGSLVAIVSFLGFWGLFIVPNLVSNVFNFGQMHHSMLTIERIEAEQKQQRDIERNEAEQKQRDTESKRRQEQV